MNDLLDVYLHGEHVAQLAVNGQRRFEMRYQQSAFVRGIPVTLAMPVADVAFPDERARPYFSNLLPEGEVRTAVARQVGVSPANDFGLLDALAGDCPGAVTLVRAGTEIPAAGEYRGLAEHELHALVELLAQRPLLANVEGVRQTLAGDHNKLAVAVEDGIVHACLGGNASTHILKAPIDGLPDTVDNEAFCMKLAAVMGLPVVAVAVREVIDRLLVVERFDRVSDGGSVTRLHQEDFCQALSVLPETKFQREGGAGIGRCISAVRRYSTRPAADTRTLMQWMMFNYLVGNCAAHAKNLAFLYAADGPRLAPFYDLMCTSVYPEINDRLAMSVGGEDRPDWVIASRWQRMAQEVGMNYRYLRTILTTMAAKITPAARTLAEEFQRSHGYSAVIPAVLRVIENRARTVNVSFAQEAA